MFSMTDYFALLGAIRESAEGDDNRTMKAQDIQAALRGVPELRIGETTTAAQADAAFPMLAAFNDGGVYAGRFSGLTPWERHTSSDELVHVLEGKVEITLLADAGPETVTVSAGSIFVVPRGLWHRQLPRPSVLLLTVTPRPTEVSFAEDPRRP